MSEFCEWKQVGFMFYPDCCQKKNKDIQMGQTDTEVFKFCPFCGKQIKPINFEGKEIKFVSRGKK
jgi:hypothetical protein